MSFDAQVATARLRSVLIPTHSEVARKTGICVNTISAWAAGHNLPGARNLALLARYSGRSVDWLLGLVDEDTDDTAAAAAQGSDAENTFTGA